MKNSKLSLATILAIFIFSAVAYSSCTKKHIDDADKFVGSWGLTTCTVWGNKTENPLTFSKGDANTITLPYIVGNGALCQQTKTLSLKVNGNVATFSTTFTDGCNQTFNLNGSATLNGSTLTYVVSASQPAATETCTVTATR